MQQKPQILPYDKTRDFNNVVELFKQERQTLYPSPIQEHDIDSLIEYLCTPKNTYVCRTPSNFVGFIQFCCMPAKRYCCGLWNLQAKYSINYIAIGGTFRRMGYGKMLMNHVLDIMAKRDGNFKSVDTFTLSTNQAADRLLARTGFRSATDSCSAHVFYIKTLSSLHSEKAQ